MQDFVGDRNRRVKFPSIGKPFHWLVSVPDKNRVSRDAPASSNVPCDVSWEGCEDLPNLVNKIATDKMATLLINVVFLVELSNEISLFPSKKPTVNIL